MACKEFKLLTDVSKVRRTLIFIVNIANLILLIYGVVPLYNAIQPTAMAGWHVKYVNAMNDQQTCLNRQVGSNQIE